MLLQQSSQDTDSSDQATDLVCGSGASELWWGDSSRLGWSNTSSASWHWGTASWVDWSGAGLELASYNTSNEEVGVGVGEESRWVTLDLLEAESGTSIGNVVSHLEAGHEWTSDTSRALSDGVVTDWVWKGDAWRPIASASSLMNVSGSSSWRLVGSADTSQGDVVADDLVVGVEDIVELSTGTWLSWSGNTGSVDNLIRSSSDVEDTGDSGRADSSKAEEGKTVLHVCEVIDLKLEYRETI